MAATSGPTDEFYQELRGFIDKPRLGWVLVPKPASEQMSLYASKLGGSPYHDGGKVWPSCPKCRVPLNFILQLHRRQFPQMWFPTNKNLFQLFRCPNGYCKASHKAADRFMLARFVQTRAGFRIPLDCPAVDLQSQFDHYESPLEQHGFSVTRIQDYPSYYEGCMSWWGEAWGRFQDKYSRGPNYNAFENDWFFEGDFWSQIANQPGIKIAGLPSWQQAGYPPKCRCGKIKDFIFQLASVYGEIGDHKQVGIGDAGNIYYFVCQACGENSLQSCWDCG